MRVAGLVASALVVAVGTASAQTSPARVVDRTLFCRAVGAGFPDPVRTVSIVASGRRGEWSPQMSLLHGNGLAPSGWSAGARTGPNPQRATGGAHFTWRGLCSAHPARIALVPRRLEGGRTRLTQTWSCDVPARVLVRIRAVFRRSVRLRPDRLAPEILVANGAIAEAQVVLTTPQRRPIALLSIAGTRNAASVFVDPARCFVQ